MGYLALLLRARLPLWAVFVICVPLCLFAGRQMSRLADARASLATEQRDRAVEQRDRAAERTRMEAAAREQAERFRAIEQGWNDAQRENERIARKARDLAAQDVAAAAGAGERLRERAAVVAAACRGPARDPVTVAAGAAASAPGDVLVDVLGRLDEAGRLIAAYADSARISAEQCAADYEALRTARQSGQMGAQRDETGAVAQP